MCSKHRRGGHPPNPFYRPVLPKYPNQTKESQERKPQISSECPQQNPQQNTSKPNLATGEKWDLSTTEWDLFNNYKSM
jgi:hypothetical protein